MYGRREKVRINCECMGGGKERIKCECMGGEEGYESSVNVWEERKGTNQL